MGVGTAEDLVVVVPLLVQRPQHAKRTHELARQKHVVDDALEVKPTTSIDNISSTSEPTTGPTLHACQTKCSQSNHIIWISHAKVITNPFCNQDQKNSQNFILLMIPIQTALNL